jgi:hypothetical protein
MNRIIRNLRLFAMVGLLPISQGFWVPHPVQAQSSPQCATPGKDGIDTGIVNVVNTYYPSIASVSAGATSIQVAPINSAGNTIPINTGDLLLVIQMQDADINFTDSTNYGANNGTASGASSVNNTGLYEYVVATNNVGVAGGTITIRGMGAGGGLINSYRNRNASLTANGQSRFQVIRVPQYTNATLSSTIRSPGAWNGTSGGVVAVDVAGTLTLAGGTIEVQDKGFRGGGGTTNTDTYPAQEDESFRTNGTIARGGMKGEGIAGTPLRVFDGISSVSTGIDGYPRLRSQDTYPLRTGDPTTNGGSRGRGAPGNAGGGGNQHNAGGGGGGNWGAGGQGGNSINSPPISETPATGVSKPIGGRGGAAFRLVTNNQQPNRLIMGGGGGAGDANNGQSGSGGLGGGIIIIRAAQITGNGAISAKARDGEETPTDDGGSGAGAGGSILISAKGGSLANISLDARGGKGGDTNTKTTVPYDFGPGGGGGGGVIYSSLPVPSATVTGGNPGRSFNGQLGGTTGVTRGAQSGSDGQVFAGTDTLLDIPGIKSGAECLANILLVKRITAINGQPINPNDNTPLNQVVDDTTSIYKENDNYPYWPNEYLKGAINAGLVKSADEVEFSIYFISTGLNNAQSVRLCDRIPPNQTFVINPSNYSTLPQASGGIAGVDRGLAIQLSGVQRSYTNASDGDIAQYFEPGTDPATVYPNINCGGSNINGAIVINLGSLPGANSQGSPPSSYGVIRFQAKVK